LSADLNASFEVVWIRLAVSVFIIHQLEKTALQVILTVLFLCVVTVEVVVWTSYSHRIQIIKTV